MVSSKKSSSILTVLSACYVSCKYIERLKFQTDTYCISAYSTIFNGVLVKLRFTKTSIDFWYTKLECMRYSLIGWSCSGIPDPTMHEQVTLFFFCTYQKMVAVSASCAYLYLSYR